MDSGFRRNDEQNRTASLEQVAILGGPLEGVAQKEVFHLPRISPQLPAFPLTLHDAANPPSSGLLKKP